MCHRAYAFIVLQDEQFQYGPLALYHTDQSLQRRKIDDEKTFSNITAVSLVALLSGCGTLPIINSLKEREKAAYEAVVKEPNDENIKRYMELADKMQKRMRKKPNGKLTKLPESDKGFIEYFKQYARNKDQ